jgi:hypothetical protein
MIRWESKVRLSVRVPVSWEVALKPVRVCLLADCPEFKALKDKNSKKESA